MLVIAIWKGICESLGTPGGSLALLTIILLVFMPLLWHNDSEGWKAVMFILGAIAGLINNRTQSSTSTTKTATTVETETDLSKEPQSTIIKG